MPAFKYSFLFSSKILYLPILLIISVAVNAQSNSILNTTLPPYFHDGYSKKGVSRSDYKKDTLTQFFDYKWEKTGKKGAYFYTIAYPSNNSWVCEDYDVMEQKIANYITYANPELSILNGSFFSFYTNGNTKTSGQFLNNQKEALWLTYYENGQLKDSAYYLHNTPVGERYSFYPSGKVEKLIAYDSLGKGVGKYTGYYEDGTINQTGTYMRGERKDDVWKYYYPDGKVSFVETFLADSLIAVQCFDKDGTPKNTCKVNEMPEFPGDLQKYLAQNIRWPRGLEFKDTNVAKVVATFKIDKEGNIKDIRIVRYIAKAFDNEVLRVIQKMPQWKPGKKYGEPVETQYTLPISFRVQSH